MADRLKVHVYGDSMIRNLGLDNSIDAEVFCCPGAKISFLVEKIELSDIEPSGVHAVILHVGTNNLSSSVWNIDRHLYRRLYNTTREKYPEAKILFNGILPRWDLDCLHDKSVYYNIHLHILTTELYTCNCYFIDLCDFFVCTDKYYGWDGLHLNKRGKVKFAVELSASIQNIFKPKLKCNGRIPAELKKLYTPKIKRQKKGGESDKDSTRTAEENVSEKASKNSNENASDEEGQTHHENVSVKEDDGKTRCSGKEYHTKNETRKATRRKRGRRKRKKRKVVKDSEGFVTPARMAPPPKRPEHLDYIDPTSTGSAHSICANFILQNRLHEQQRQS